MQTPVFTESIIMQYQSKRLKCQHQNISRMQVLGGLYKMLQYPDRHVPSYRTLKFSLSQKGIQTNLMFQYFFLTVTANSLLFFQDLADTSMAWSSESVLSGTPDTASSFLSPVTIVHTQSLAALPALTYSKQKPSFSGRRSMTCRFCQKIFYHRNDLNKHERTHTGEKPYVCLLCGLRYARTDNLKYHQRTKHSEQLNFV